MTASSAIGRSVALIALLAAGACGGPSSPSPPATDDITVTQVVVAGQGVIPWGGSVDVPVDGVTITFRGTYQLRGTQPPRLFIEAYPFSSEIFGTGAAPRTGGPQGAGTWEITMTRWVPCAGGPLNLRCVTITESIHVGLSDPDGRAGAGTVIVNKEQPWPIAYRLAPGCCRYPYS